MPSDNTFDYDDTILHAEFRRGQIFDVATAPYLQGMPSEDMGIDNPPGGLTNTPLPSSQLSQFDNKQSNFFQPLHASASLPLKVYEETVTSGKVVGDNTRSSILYCDQNLYVTCSNPEHAHAGIMPSHE
jgi:hypothetical protein